MLTRLKLLNKYFKNTQKYVSNINILPLSQILLPIRQQQSDAQNIKINQLQAQYTNIIYHLSKNNYALLLPPNRLYFCLNYYHSTMKQFHGDQTVQNNQSETISSNNYTNTNRNASQNQSAGRDKQKQSKISSNLYKLSGQRKPKSIKSQRFDRTPRSQSKNLNLMYHRQNNVYSSNNIQDQIHKYLYSFLQSNINQLTTNQFIGFDLSMIIPHATGSNFMQNITKNSNIKPSHIEVLKKIQLLVQKIEKKIKSKQFQVQMSQCKAGPFSNYIYKKVFDSKMQEKAFMLQYKKFEFFSNLISKFKKQGIESYNMEAYKIIFYICHRIVSISNLQQFVNKIADKMMKNHQKNFITATQLNSKNNVKEQSNKVERKQNEKQNSNIRQQNSNIRQQNENEKKAEQTKRYKHSLITIPQLAILIQNIYILPEPIQNNIKQQFLQKLQQIDFNIICRFMLDTITFKTDLSMQFLVRFHDTVRFFTIYNSARYSYLLFIQYFMDKYFPLHSPMSIFKKSYQFQGLINYRMIYNKVKLIALQYQIALKCLSKTWLYGYNKKIDALDKFLIQKKLSKLQIIKIYNMLSKVHPLGQTFIRQQPNYSKRDNSSQNQKKELLQEKEQLKQFVLNICQNLKPKYIYTIEQKSLNQINNTMLNFTREILSVILMTDPWFIVETTQFFNFQNLTNKNTLNIKNCIEILLVQLNKISQKAIENIVINKNQAGVKNLPQKVEIDKRKTKQYSQQQKIQKLINFISKNLEYLEQAKMKNFINDIFQNVMKLNIENTQMIKNSSWKFLFQLSKIIYFLEYKTKSKNNQNIEIAQKEKQKQNQAQQINNQKNNQKIIELYNKYCHPYIMQNQQTKQGNVIRQPKLYQQYILRIARLIRNHPYFLLNNQKNSQKLINFINNNFIYTVKSVIKVSIFEILQLFDKLVQKTGYQINPQIYAFLYGNLSSFIMYVQSSGNFYLKRGKNLQYDQKYYKTLTGALKNWKTLNKIVNKDQLSTLKLLSRLYWKKLSNKQIGQLLMIVGTPTLLGQKLRLKIQKSLNFTKQQQIQGLDLRILNSFKFQNKSLMNLLSISGNAKFDSKLTNQRSKQQLNQLFKNNEFYQQALETQQFTSQQLIPPPNTKDVKVKMIYACLKIVQKIRQNCNFSISKLLYQLDNQSTKQLERVQKSANQILPEQQKDISQQKDINQQKQAKSKEKRKKKKKISINFQQVHRYIAQQGLVKIDRLNEFKLGNVQTKGHNQMIQCWNVYNQQVDNLILIQDYSIFGDADSNPYQKVLLAFSGNYGLVKQLVKKQPFYNQVLKQASAQKLQCATKGSLIEISSKKTNESQKQLYIFCSNDTNYKLHTIYSYILSEIGYRVCQMDHKTSKQQISQLLSKAFPRKYNQQNLNNQQDVDIDLDLISRQQQESIQQFRP